MIITILIALVFVALLAKALIETICGLTTATYALFILVVVVPALRLAAFVVRMFGKPEPKAKSRSKSRGHIAGAIRFS